MDRNRVIGKDGELPWRLPNDLKRFKRLTQGHPILMGRKTWESIGRPLPGRLNLVLTRDPAFQAEGVEVVRSPEEALEKTGDRPWLFVIGGEHVYGAFLPRAERLYLTRVDAETEGGDAFFPEWDPAWFEEVSREAFPADDRHDCAYTFLEYAKVG